MKTEQKKRNEMMVQVAKLRAMRCEKCKTDKEWAKGCQCDAAVKLRELKKVENDVVVKGELTVEKYKELKYEGFSDVAIMNDLGWNGNKMNEWKRDNNLIGKKFEKVEVELQDLPVMDWEVLYKELKDEHELTKTKYGYAKKELLDLGKELDECHSQVKALELKYSSVVKDYEDLGVEYDQLLDATSDGLVKPSTILELETRILEQETDYKNLERNYKFLENKNGWLKKSIDRLKHTETMNLMMMERYLDLNKQLDDVLS